MWRSSARAGRGRPRSREACGAADLALCRAKRCIKRVPLRRAFLAAAAPLALHCLPFGSRAARLAAQRGASPDMWGPGPVA
jgi:hypothetical protein